MSVIIGRALPIGGGTDKQLDFTYTGEYNERLDDGVVELLTSGVITFKKPQLVDIFLVGGGSAPGRDSNKRSCSGGGGGGYTATFKSVTVKDSYNVNIGAGAIAPSFGAGVAGGRTSFGTQFSVNGGAAGTNVYSRGLDGGSGGGGTGTAAGTGTGGSDGSDGKGGSSTVGKGQGSTTREFGESTGKLYAGGGGAGTDSSYSPINKGGEGGGGDGSFTGKPGTPNTGGGGGGSYQFNHPGGNGGSGIVCIRLHKEA